MLRERKTEEHAIRGAGGPRAEVAARLGDQRANVKCSATNSLHSIDLYYYDDHHMNVRHLRREVAARNGLPTTSSQVIHLCVSTCLCKVKAGDVYAFVRCSVLLQLRCNHFASSDTYVLTCKNSITSPLFSLENGTGNGIQMIA